MLHLNALPNPNDPLFSGKVTIDKPKFTIGRGENNDWIINDPKRLVSKVHCIIENINGEYRLLDNSTNGSMVNSKQVSSSGQILHNGDQIEFVQYRFEIQLLPGSSEQKLSSEFSDTPQITSILHDIAPAGVTASSPIKGQQDNDLLATPLDQNISKRQGTAKLGDIGWEGPPEEKDDIVGAPDIIEPVNRELINKHEQVPTEKQIMDLPKTNSVIPDNWLKTADAPPEIVPEQIIETKLKSDEVDIIPVENINLNNNQEQQENNSKAEYEIASVTLPTSADNHFNDSELITAFCNGFGVEKNTLENTNHIELFHNIGRLANINITELLNLHITKNASSTRLETGWNDNNARTPWIFSVSGEDKAQIMQHVLDFLAESEPRDLEMIRPDYQDIQDYMEDVSSAILSLIETLQQALSPEELQKNISPASKALPALKKAALWDALIESSNLYKKNSKNKLNADILSLFIESLQKQRS